MKGKKMASKWDQRMKELKDHMKKFGHTQVPSTVPSRGALCSWLCSCRKRRFGPHNNSPQLTQEEMNLLDEVDPNWHAPIRGTHGSAWDAQIAGLELFLSVSPVL